MFIPDLLGHIGFARRALRWHSLNTCLGPFLIYILYDSTNIEQLGENEVFT